MRVLFLACLAVLGRAGLALETSPRALSRRAAFQGASALLTGVGLEKEGRQPTHLRGMSLSEAANFPGDAWPMAMYPDPILRREAKRVQQSYFKFPTSQTLAIVARKLEATCRKEGAVGLAAQQCGVDASIVYLEDTGGGGKEGLVLVNPRIVDRSPEKDMKVWREFCLVLPPDIKVTLLRDAVVTVNFEDLDGNTISRTLVGEAARALQHEMDHDRG